MDPLQEQAIHQERVICIGAGASGLLFTYKLQRSFRNFTLTVYEKNEEVSGTWFENTYPGCACDVPAHNYTYSFEPKHDWSTVYASSQEIKQYFESFTRKYSLHKYIKLRHRVSSARWIESDGLWEVEIIDINNGSTLHETCHILINATGYLNDWDWPQIPGLGEFKGQLVHSANWKNGIDLRGRKVNLIGNGSSAVQILPAIQPIVESLTTFIRSPLWLLPAIAEEQDNYSREMIEDFHSNPKSLMQLRKINETVVNSIFSVYLSNSILQSQSRVLLENEMRKTIKDERLEKVLIPTWGVGCRRLTPGGEYLVSLFQENVKVVQGGVIAFTEQGCKAEGGTDYPAEVIICATVFNTSFIPRFPILGQEGRSLQTIWAQVPSSYLGIAASGFPNFFIFLGPYSPVGNGPTMAAIETQADYILAFIDRYQTENMHSFTPKPAAESDFSAHVADFMKTAVYSEGCRSGHKNHTINDRVPTLWPGSTLHYMEAMRELRADDWNIEYTGNRFAWLGNGISQTEFDPTSDLGWYIRDEDDSPYATRGKRREQRTRSGTQPARVLHRTHRPSVLNL